MCVKMSCRYLYWDHVTSAWTISPKYGSRTTHRCLEKLVDVLVTRGCRVWWLKRTLKIHRKIRRKKHLGSTRWVWLGSLFSRNYAGIVIGLRRCFCWPFVFMTQEAHRKTTKTHDPSRGFSGRISSFLAVKFISVKDKPYWLRWSFRRCPFRNLSIRKRRRWLVNKMRAYVPSYSKLGVNHYLE